MEVVETKITHKQIKQALLIRSVEEMFLTLFSQGKLNGTVHTCVGQEFSAIAFAGQLKKGDFIFSNHRCHGHYLAFTKDVRGLLAELLGKASGTCGGIGSSQHLCKDNFFSNGIQGGIIPVAAGYALANKLKQNGAVGIVFIGDGTLGEGALYETMNIISKWEIPLLIVCENNFYAQSTPQSVNLAGDIQARAQAFDINTYKGTTWEPELLIEKASIAIEEVRKTQQPIFFLVETFRLNAHSKGDDDRAESELTHYKGKDYLNQFKKESPIYYDNYIKEINTKIERLVTEILLEEELPIESYYQASTLVSNVNWKAIAPINQRQVERLNGFFKQKIEQDDRVLFIGEDILSPYGGAFKVAKDLSFIRPAQVFSTPISEAAIAGISNGLALNGFKPFVEIMFGDFVTLALDQIINHASKFYHMFNKQITCPVVFRMPMGGYRGYGPTHSQTLDKFLIGIDNIKTIALNVFIDPARLYDCIYLEKHPVIVIENKADYGKKIMHHKSSNFIYESNQDNYPVVKICPVASKPTLTIVAYGGIADMVATILEEIFVETDFKPELIVPTLLSNLPIDIIYNSARNTQRLVVIEEGSAYAGVGSELISALMEQMDAPIQIKRIAAYPVPIPSVKSLENTVLPDKKRIIQTIKESFL